MTYVLYLVLGLATFAVLAVMTEAIERQERS